MPSASAFLGDACKHRTTRRGPILGDHRVAHVDAPAACNLHIPPRVALAREPAPVDERVRALVARLDVDLHAMQPDVAIRGIEEQYERLRHQPASGMRREHIVAEVCTFERAADDFGKVEHADERVVLDLRRNVTHVLRAPQWLAEALEILAERSAPGWGRAPGRVQPAALADGGDE